MHTYWRLNKRRVHFVIVSNLTAFARWCATWRTGACSQRSSRVTACKVRRCLHKDAKLRVDERQLAIVCEVLPR